VSSNAAQSLSALLDELARTLPQYQALFDELKSQGFTTASTILLNGSAISMSDLQKLLNKLRQNPDAVTAAGLE
jgi:Tfp pilus assembly protein PilN